MAIVKILPPHLRQLAPNSNPIQRVAAQDVLREVILTDQMLTSLMYVPQATNAFPFLKIQLPEQPKKKCNCNRTMTNVADLSKKLMVVKQQIAGLSPDAIKNLKGILHADRVILYLATVNGIEKKVL